MVRNIVRATWDSALEAGCCRQTEQKRTGTGNRKKAKIRIMFYVIQNLGGRFGGRCCAEGRDGTLSKRTVFCEMAGSGTYRYVDDANHGEEGRYSCPGPRLPPLAIDDAHQDGHPAE